MRSIFVLFLVAMVGLAVMGFQDPPLAETNPAEPAEQPVTPTPVVPVEVEPVPPPPPPPTYQLKPSFDINKVIAIEEEQKWEGTHTIDPGEKAESYPFLRHTRHNYNEHIVMMTSDHRNINTKRIYTFSHKKTNIPGEGIQNEIISLKDKTLYLESADYHITKMDKLSPKEGVIITEDYMYVSAINWFYLLLPREPLTIGEAYELNSDQVAEIFFRDSYDEKLCKATGSGRLEAKFTYEGQECLQSIINVRLTRDDPVNKATVEIELSGSYIVAIEQKVLVDLELNGSFTLNQTAVSETKRKVNIRSEGTILNKFKFRETAVPEKPASTETPK